MNHTFPALPLKQTALALATCFASGVFALPTAPTVVNGNASFNQTGNALTVTNSNGTIINWNTFSIGAGESTYFAQPNVASSVLNRVVGRDPSSIYGTLGSNGRVYLVNPQGIFVGPGGRVDVHRFVGSTLALTDQDFLGGRLNFRRDPELKAGAVRNEGTITTPSGGQVYLVGGEVANHGAITAPGGEIGLLAGHAVQLIDSGTPGVRVELSATDERVQNFGVVAASGGRIGLAAALTENAGLISANAVHSEGGRVWLRATHQVTVGADARIDAGGTLGGAIVIHADGKTEVAGKVEARGLAAGGGAIEVLGHQVALVDQARVDASGQQGGGRVLIGGDLKGENLRIPNADTTFLGPATQVRADALGDGDGGIVVLWSEHATRALGRISARGGASGGDGGFVETSSRDYLDVRHAPDVVAPVGDGGSWLLDPHNLTIVSGAGNLDNQDTLAPYDFTANADSSTLDVAVVNAALNGGADVTINTGNDTLSGESGTLTVAAPILKSAGATSNLTLLSAGDTLINSPIQSTVGILNLYTGSGLPGGAQKVEIKADVLLNGGLFDATGGSSRVSFPLSTPVTVSATALSADEVAFGANTNVTLNTGAVNTRRFLMPSGTVQVNGSVSMYSGAGTPGLLSIGGGTLNVTGGLSTSTPEFALALSGGTLVAGGSVLLHQTSGNASITTNIQANSLTATVSAGNLDFFGGATLGSGGLSATANNTGLFNTAYSVGGPLTVSSHLKIGTNASLTLGTGTLYIGGNLLLDPNLGGGVTLASSAAGTRRTLEIGGVLEVNDPDVSGVGAVNFTDLDLQGPSFSAMTQANFATHNVTLNNSSLWTGAFSLASGSITGAGGSIDVDSGFTHTGGTLDFGRSAGSLIDVTDNAVTLTLSRPLSAETIRIGTPFGKIQDPTGTATLSANKVDLSSCSSCSSVMTGGIGSATNPIRLSNATELAVYVGGGVPPPADVFVKNSSVSTTLALAGLNNNSPGGKIDVESSATINFSDYCPDSCESNVVTNGGPVRIAATGAGTTINVAGNAAPHHVHTENSSATASGNIDLAAPGGIGAPTVPLRIGTLHAATVTANAGSAGVSLQYVGGDLNLSQVIASGNNVHLDSSTGKVIVDANRAVAPGNGLYLSAVGDVLQSGGTITGGGDLFLKGNTIDFSPGGNSVANLTAEGYSIDFANSYAGLMKLGKAGVVASWQNINGLDGAAVNISNANGSIATDSGKSISGGALTLSAAGSLTATTAGYAASLSASTGAITLVNTGNLQLKAATTGGALSVTATGGDLAVFDVTPPTISATGAILLKGTTVAISNATLQSSASGNAVRIEADTTFSASAATINPGSGRWLIYSADPGTTTRGSLEPNMNFKQYNASFASAPMGAGNGFLYAAAPAIASTASGNVTKTYDGLATGPGAGIAVITSSNLIDGDVYGGGSATGVIFTSKNVGASIAGINYAASTITYGAGIPVYGYTETFTNTGVTGSITPAVISTISGIGAASRPYDGSNVASLNTVGVSFAGLVAGDNLTVGGATATFNDKSVGLAKPVTITGIALSGTDSGNYILAAGAGIASASADITPLALSLTGTLAANKTYDGTTAATVITPGTLNGMVAGDFVNVTTGTATFGNKNVGNSKPVTLTGLALFGADAGNYTLPATASTTANITPRTITASGATVANKVYDGNTAATVTGVTFSGAIAGDNLSMTGATGLFANKNVGTGKPVTVTFGTLSGSDAGNYLLSGAGGLAASADITAKSLTLNGFTAASKTYDGTTAATITGGILGGVIAGDVVTFQGATGAFSDKNAGLAKSISVSGGTLSGIDAGNYLLAAGAPSATTADILPKDISLGQYTVAGKIYDGTPVATITGSLLNGTIAGDDVRISGAAALFNDKNVGVGKPVAITGGALAGTDAANYRITGGTSASATADITAKSVVVSSFNAANKVYDGTLAATIVGANLEGIVGGDSVEVVGATGVFLNKNVGDAKPVQVSGGALTGADAGNYVFATGNGGNATASITPRPISLDSFSAADKVYDGTTAATVVQMGAPSGAIASDNVFITGGVANFSDKNVGDAKTVTLAGINLGGTDAGNYSLSATTPAALASITPKSVSLGTASAAAKVYDGALTATVTSVSLAGTIAGDDIGVAGSSGAFSSKEAGTGKEVRVIGGALTGVDARNYALAPESSVSTTADITPRLISLSGTLAADKVYDGTTVATLDNFGTLQGVVPGDQVFPQGGSGAFANKDAGTGKAVSFGGIELSGGDANNYRLTQPTGLTASISRRDQVRWTGDGGNDLWSNAGNWQGGAIPDLENVARVEIPSGSDVRYNLGTRTRLDEIGSAGTLGFAGAGTLVVGGLLDTAGFRLDAGTLELGALTVRNNFQQAPDTTLRVSGHVDITQASGPLTLAMNAASATLDAAGPIDAVFNESARRMLTLNRAVARSGDLRITGYGGINTELTASAPAGRVFLTAKSPLTIGPGGIVAAGDIQLLADGSTPDDLLSVGGTISSNAGDISLTGASVAENASVTTRGGDINILAVGGNITTIEGVVNESFGGNIFFDAPTGDIQISSVNAGTGSVSLRSGGSISPVGSGTNIVANNLAVNAGGNLRLTTSVRNPPVIQVAGTREVTDNSPRISSSGDADPIRVLPTGNETRDGADNPLGQVVGLLAGEGPGSRAGNPPASEPRPGTFGYEEGEGSTRTTTSGEPESDGGTSDDERRNRRPGRCRA